MDIVTEDMQKVRVTEEDAGTGGDGPLRKLKGAAESKRRRKRFFSVIVQILETLKKCGLTDDPLHGSTHTQVWRRGSCCVWARYAQLMYGGE